MVLMRWLKVWFGLIFAASFGWSGTQSDEKVGDLTFKLPPGWSKVIRGNVATLKPGDALASATCVVTITAGLQASGDLPQWLDKQFHPHVGTRQVVSKVPIPYQNDPDGWEACGLSAILYFNPN